MSDTPKVKRGKLSDLKPLVNNPNAGSERGQYMLEESFTQAGAGRSILIAANGDILAGNHASEAYGQLLDNDEVLIVETDGKTLVAVQRTDIASADDPKGKTLIIADNRASDFHEYDAGVIIGLLQTDEALIKHYFMEDELQALLAEIADEEPPADPGAQVDRAAELQKVWNVERGQVWEIPSKATPGKSHRVMCGDSTDKADVDKLMGGERAEICVTSPPYWINREYEQENGAALILEHIHNASAGIMQAVTEDRPHIMINTGISLESRNGGNFRNVWLLVDWWQQAFREHAIYLRNVRIWAKKGGFLSFTPQQDVVQHGWEFLASFTTAKPRSQNRINESWAIDGLWDVNAETHTPEHSAPFPVEIPCRYIVLYTKNGDLIFEPYLGSGTTLIAAEQTARVCYGMEIAPEYCAVILERAKGIGLTPQVMNG